MEPLYAQNEEEVLMNIIISNSSGKPIYEQITAQIKGMIMNGALKPGDPLPSMRLLAKELRISVITTKRAYEELERDGFISTIVGKGSFVREADREFVREEKLKAVTIPIFLGILTIFLFLLLSKRPSLSNFFLSCS